jgi:hypothetical protein
MEGHVEPPRIHIARNGCQKSHSQMGEQRNRSQIDGTAVEKETHNATSFTVEAVEIRARKYKKHSNCNRYV